MRKWLPLSGNQEGLRLVVVVVKVEMIEDRLCGCLRLGGWATC